MDTARKISPKPVELREADFRREVNGYTRYPQDMRNDFIDYWRETDWAPIQKMRFEKEKTWSLSLRLSRWARTNFGNQRGIVKNTPVIHISTKNPVEPSNEIEYLDSILTRFAKNPTGVTIEKLTQWKGLNECYEAIKKHRLWDQTLTKQDLGQYTDQIRLKAYVVYRTLNYYGLKGWLFSDTIKTRQ